MFYLQYRGVMWFSSVKILKMMDGKLMFVSCTKGGMQTTSNNSLFCWKTRRNVAGISFKNTYRGAGKRSSRFLTCFPSNKVEKGPTGIKRSYPCAIRFVCWAAKGQNKQFASVFKAWTADVTLIHFPWAARPNRKGHFLFSKVRKPNWNYYALDFWKFKITRTCPASAIFWE